ncbi:Tetracycline resistance protein, class B [Anaerolineales bacterium]|nr:Tetracycline resistance protein, class B [Anaerolineales bacterium]
MSARTIRQSTGILIAMAFCMALQMTGFVMILPLFARRFESFGAGVEAFGISAMAYALTSTIAAPFIGTLADRFGRRPIILFSLAAYILAFSGYLFAASAWLLILLRGLAGALTAGLIPAITGSVGDLASEDRRAQWIGIVNGGASVGWIAGPVLGGQLYDHCGYVVPFAVAIVMAVGALLLAVFLIPETYRDAHFDRPQSSLKSGFQTLFSSSTFFLLMLISFGVLFAWAFIEPQFMFYAYDDLGWTSSQLGLTMSTYGVALMFGEFTLGRLSDRLGRKPVLIFGLALFSAQFIGLAVFHNATWIVLSFILAGLGNGLYDPALGAYILDITPPEYKARSMGLKSTLGSLGSLFGPALVVLISPLTGPQAVFLISAGLVWMLTFISGLILHTPQPPRDTRFESQSVLTLQK